MPKFQYTAVNNEGKTLHGVVEAENLKEAKVELNVIGLKVVNLEEVDLKTKLLKSNLNKYKFEAVNQQGKVVKGTIAALDQNLALSRLNTEYFLDVKKISHINASNKSFDSSAPKNQKKDEFVSSVEDPVRVKALRANLIPLIDDIKSMMKFVKEDLYDCVGVNVIEFIDKYILHLDKIKFSENVYNVQSVCLKICNVFETSDVFIETGTKDEDKLRINLMARELEKKLKYFDSPPSKMPKFIDQGESSLVLFNMLLSSKSGSQRKLIVGKIWKNFIDFFAIDSIKNNLPLSYIKDLSLWFFIIYLMLFLGFHFLSKKALNFELPQIFYIYQTNILLYVAVFFMLLHFGIELSNFIKNNLMKFAINSIFMVIFLMICINL